MLFLQEDAANEVANGAEPAAEQTNELVSGSTEAASRLMEGDFSSDTWVLLWDSVGWPVTKAIVLIILVFIVAGWVSKLTGKAVRRAKVEETLARFLSNIARYIVLIAGGVAILGTLGVETTSFAAVIAAVGFAIGMAMSGMLGNIASGVMLLLFRPFKVGDVVSAGGTTGKIFEIGLFTTVFDTPDNRRIIVPNNEIFGGTIENVSHHATRRVSIDVGTDYGADIDKAREVMLAAASGTDNVLTDPAPAVVLTGLGGSSIDWSVRVWVNAADYWAVMDQLTRNVKVALDEAEIGIPFPQMDVHIDGKVAQGGPFIPVKPEDAGGQLMQKLTRLDDHLGQWETLQAVMGRLPLAAPLNTYYVTSSFGKRRDPMNKRWSAHYGVDFGGPMRSPVYAPASGLVTKAGVKGRYGRFIEIDHGSGIITRYGHLNKILVKRGDKIEFRQKIAQLGNSGRSTGPHLHYEIVFNGKPKDPMKFIKAGRHVFQKQ